MEKHAKLIAIKEEMRMCVGVANAQLFSASGLCAHNLVHLYLREACPPACCLFAFLSFSTLSISSISYLGLWNEK